MNYSNKTITRYILFQIPELIITISILLVIKYFYAYPFWIFWIIILFSIVKDIFLFFKTWPSYIVHNQQEFSQKEGQTGTAISDIEKSGYININGELWKVLVSEPVKKGERLIVNEVNGLILKASKKN